MTLTLTFNTDIDGAAEVSTYDREYPSLAEFLTDYADTYNATYGTENWSAVEKTELPSDFSVDTYTIQNGELVKASAEIITKREAAKQAIADVAEIAELRAYLTQTDYAAIKCGEIGLSMAEVYPELHTARTKARERINELQEGGAE